MQFKSRQAQGEKDYAEIQYYELRNENKYLREINKDLMNNIKNILESQGNNKLKKKR